MVSIANRQQDVDKESIVLGGGCFWCTEALFSRMRGVISAEVGYAGGDKPNPTYGEVCSGKTGHAEVVRIGFDKTQTSLEKIIESFLGFHNPTELNKQGSDVGTQYRSVILVNSKNDLNTVIKICKSMQKKYPDPIVTQIKMLDKFWPAEEYHRNYFEKHPDAHYCQLVIKPKLDKYNQEFN